jgi:hypothetical protein
LIDLLMIRGIGRELSIMLETDGALGVVCRIVEAGDLLTPFCWLQAHGEGEVCLSKLEKLDDVCIHFSLDLGDLACI